MSEIARLEEKLAKQWSEITKTQARLIAKKRGIETKRSYSMFYMRSKVCSAWSNY